MKILLDPQIFLWQKFGGVSQLYVELLKYAGKWKEPDIIWPLVYSENLHLKEAGLNPRNIFTGLHQFNFKGTGRMKAMLKAASVRKTKKLLSKGDFDVFFPTYYDPYFLNYLKQRPFVLVVHDMIHEIFPEYFRGDKTTVPNKKLLIEKADKIITNSFHTKRDILCFYPHIPENKIEPVHHAQSIEDPDKAEAVDLPEEFILFVGNREGYKNFTYLVESLAEILKERKTLYLVCAGGSIFSEEEKKTLKKLKIENKVIQKKFRDSELPSFYRAAKVFIFPSLYEGFGIPTLEAMKCGCPVILANSSCFPEIAADAAIYFDPGSSSSLIQALENILEDEDLRSKMIKRGYDRVKEFSWEKTAKGYFSVIKQMI